MKNTIDKIVDETIILQTFTQQDVFENMPANEIFNCLINHNAPKKTFLNEVASNTHIKFETKRELATMLNENSIVRRGISAEDQITYCEICENFSLRGGYEDDPTIWGCEGECGMTFCEQCFINECGSSIAHEMFSMDGAVEEILCPNCYKTDSEVSDGKMEQSKNT